MVNNSPAQLDRIFGALADSTRRAILARLAQGNATVSDLAKPFNTSLPAISKHLTVLESTGLITRHSVGRQKICALNKDQLNAAASWIDRYSRFWEERLDALEALLNEQG